MFEPTLQAAQAQLEAFLPKAGRDYASKRNFDNGSKKHTDVSQLSPWVRTRLLPEWTIVKRVLEKHKADAVEKFIDEVCWRTYWKGWLQLRPSIWDDYLDELKSQRDSWNNHPRYTAALRQESGIECLDAWTKELLETGYLHNHARMWYASIWIHTLQLPWTLGAAFFLKHLLDGDPASNTLSWRWVAGLHTPGKTYLARPDNIRKYTNGRFAVSEPLAGSPLVIDTKLLPSPRLLPELETPPSSLKLGLLIQEDDLSASKWVREKYEVQNIAGLFLKDIYENHWIDESVATFRTKCLKDVLGSEGDLLQSIDAAVNWAQANELDAIVMAEIPVGLWNQAIKELETALKQQNIQLYFVRPEWDECLHPNAKAGFFRLKKAIPKAIALLS